MNDYIMTNHKKIDELVDYIAQQLSSTYGCCSVAKGDNFIAISAGDKGEVEIMIKTLNDLGK